MTTVIKRDGTKEPYDVSKIRRAITLAANASEMSGNYTEHNIDLCTNIINNDFSGRDEAHIEEIQNAVEAVLMAY